MEGDRDLRPVGFAERGLQPPLLVLGEPADALVVLLDEGAAALTGKDRVLIGLLVRDRDVERAPEKGELTVDRRWCEARLPALARKAGDIAWDDLAERPSTESRPPPCGVLSPSWP